MKRTPQQSPAIASMGYDATTRTLEIEFPNSGVYQYFDVPQEVFEWFKRVPSKSAYLERHIKSQYSYAKVEPLVQVESHKQLVDLLQDSLDQAKRRDASEISAPESSETSD